MVFDDIYGHGKCRERYVNIEKSCLNGNSKMRYLFWIIPCLIILTSSLILSMVAVINARNSAAETQSLKQLVRNLAENIDSLQFIYVSEDLYKQIKTDQNVQIYDDASSKEGLWLFINNDGANFEHYLMKPSGKGLENFFNETDLKRENPPDTSTKDNKFVRNRRNVMESTSESITPTPHYSDDMENTNIASTTISPTNSEEKPYLHEFDEDYEYYRQLFIHNSRNRHNSDYDYDDEKDNGDNEKIHEHNQDYEEQREQKYNYDEDNERNDDHENDHSAILEEMRRHSLLKLNLSDLENMSRPSPCGAQIAQLHKKLKQRITRGLKLETSENLKATDEKATSSAIKITHDHATNQIRRTKRKQMENIEFMTPSPEPKVYAVHFSGDASKYVVGQHTNYNGNGHLRHLHQTYVDWVPSEWVKTLNMQEYYKLHKGQLKIMEDGLYFVYAQIYYLDEHDTNGYRVYKNEETFLQCTTMTHSTTRVMKSNTCYTAGLEYFHEGDEVSVRDIAHNRYSLFEPGKSFFGVIKFGNQILK